MKRKIAPRFIGRDDYEVFFVICLNTKNNVVAVHRCHVSSLNSSLVHPREVFISAILNNAASVIVVHQHQVVTLNHRWKILMKKISRGWKVIRHRSA